MLGNVGKWVLRLLWAVWLLAMLVVGLKIALDNTQDVQVTLFGWQAPAYSLGVTLCFALLGGVIIGWIASSGPYLLARQRARRLEKQLRKSRSDVGVHPAAPLKS